MGKLTGKETVILVLAAIACVTLVAAVVDLVALGAEHVYDLITISIGLLVLARVV